MTEIVAEQKLIPPRFWWLKRIVCCGAAWLLILIGVRLWWGWDVDRRFRAVIAERRAAGEPVLLEDFARPPIPDEENAAYFLEQAAKALKAPPGVSDVTEISAYMRADYESHRQLAAEAMDLNRDAQRAINTARSLKSVEWGITAASILTGTLPHLPRCRQLAKFEFITALQQHRSGDDAAALEAVSGGLAIGAFVGDGPLVSHLVRIACDALAVDALEEITPTLHIRGRDAQSDDPGLPDRNTVLALVRQLSDEAEFRAQWKWALCFERLSTTDYPDGPTSRMPGWSLADRLVAWPIRPALVLDGLLHFQLLNQSVEAAAGACDWPQARRQLQQSLPSPNRLIDWLHPAIWYGRPAQLSFRVLAMRNMAAIALAICLYEIDYGRRPERLEELVPEYLPVVPRDPFSAVDRPIGYAPNASPPVLYSVGNDGADDGGRFDVAPTGGVSRESADLVYFLNGDRPRGKVTAPTATSQPVETQAAPDVAPASKQAAPVDHE